jgi:hypothetical protein
VGINQALPDKPVLGTPPPAAVASDSRSQNTLW